MTGAMRILLVEMNGRSPALLRAPSGKIPTQWMWRNRVRKALELGGDVPYDAILLDVRLPDLSGIEVCRELRQRGYRVSRDDAYSAGLVEQRVEGLDAGADDYLTKPFVLAELLARVRALVRRGFHSTTRSFATQTLYLDRHRRRATRDKETIPLTSRELPSRAAFASRT